MYIVIVVFSLVILVASSAFAQRLDLPDDEFESDFRASIRRTTAFTGAVAAIDLILSPLAIFGAFKYNIKMVIPAPIWAAVSFTLGTIIQVDSNQRLEDDFPNYPRPYHVPNLITRSIAYILYIYPHVGFVLEVRSGILSPETYAREEYSCCCGPKGV